MTEINLIALKSIYAGAMSHEELYFVCAFGLVWTEWTKQTVTIKRQNGWKWKRTNVAFADASGECIIMCILSSIHIYIVQKNCGCPIPHGKCDYRVLKTLRAWNHCKRHNMSLNFKYGRTKPSFESTFDLISNQITVARAANEQRESEDSDATTSID